MDCRGLVIGYDRARGKGIGRIRVMIVDETSIV